MLKWRFFLYKNLYLNSEIINKKMIEIKGGKRYY